jgi:hypothetical protein
MSSAMSSPSAMARRSVSIPAGSGVRSLQEAAVAADDLVAVIAGQARKASLAKMIGLSAWRASVTIIAMRVARIAAANGSPTPCSAASSSAARSDRRYVRHS